VKIIAESKNLTKTVVPKAPKIDYSKINPVATEPDLVKMVYLSHDLRKLEGRYT